MPRRQPEFERSSAPHIHFAQGPRRWRLQHFLQWDGSQISYPVTHKTQKRSVAAKEIQALSPAVARLEQPALGRFAGPALAKKGKWPVAKRRLGQSAEGKGRMAPV